MDSVQRGENYEAEFFAEKRAANVNAMKSQFTHLHFDTSTGYRRTTKQLLHHSHSVVSSNILSSAP
jgi:hypothetical protein